MRNRYKVIKNHQENVFPFYYTTEVIASYKNEEPAIRHAERLADRHQTTTKYGHSKVFFEVTKDDTQVYECEDRIVPSVGELGYW